jgi:transcriptional regulator with XRE-family HTH domain
MQPHPPPCYGPRVMMTNVKLIGDLLREWRQRRRMSQSDLACDAGITTGHLSCLETGRSLPDGNTILLLAERLGLPLRERNVLLAAAGLAPQFQERRLDESALHVAHAQVDQMLSGHEPNPAFAVDRHWTLIEGNSTLWRMIGGCDPMLMRAPLNVLRLYLHPAGLAPRIANLPQWHSHIIDRLRRQIEFSGDPVLSDLLEEVRDYPVPRAPACEPDQVKDDSVAVMFRLATIDGTLSFFTTTTVFGSAMDITLAELTIESFVPADLQTAAVMRRLASGSARPSGSGVVPPATGG